MGSDQKVSANVHDGDDFAWMDTSPGEGDNIGEIYCLTFVKGIGVSEALARIGGVPGTFATRTFSDVELENLEARNPRAVAAVQLDGWTVVLEPNGWEGASMMAELSKGTEAVCVLRHDYAQPGFYYAVDGELVTGFEPTFPASLREGSDPDRLVPLMRDIGFELEDDDGGQFAGAFARSLQLARRLTGTAPTYDMLTGPLTSAHVESWHFDAPN